MTRVGRHLERQGLLVRDIENSYLQLESIDESALDELIGHRPPGCFGAEAAREPARRGQGSNETKTAAQRHVAMGWAAAGHGQRGDVRHAGRRDGILEFRSDA